MIDAFLATLAPPTEQPKCRPRGVSLATTSLILFLSHLIGRGKMFLTHQSVAQDRPFVLPLLLLLLQLLLLDLRSPEACLAQLPVA